MTMHRNPWLAALGLLAVLAAPAALAPSSGAAATRHRTPRGVPTHAALDSAMWSATTWEAATAEEHRRVLATGARARVTGEIVDVSCYLQLGKHGEAHIACAQKCATNGQPIGLLDGRHALWLLFPEEHHPRRDGGAEIRTALIPLMGKSVTLRGTATTSNGNRALYLRAADLDELKGAGAPASPKPMRTH